MRFTREPNPYVALAMAREEAMAERARRAHEATQRTCQGTPRVPRGPMVAIAACPFYCELDWCVTDEDVLKIAGHANTRADPPDENIPSPDEWKDVEY